jgi:ABC-type Zn uptake system ZnuABC Zn-binding protein ZnuA
MVLNLQTLFLTAALSIFLVSCNSQQRKADSQSDGNSTELSSDSNSITKVTGNCAIGPFHWDISEDACSTISDTWIKQISGSGNVPFFCGLRLKDEALLPTFNGDGHLIALRIIFSDFTIHPESDYSKEEKAEIERMLLEHNKRISLLIRNLSDMYGDATANEFNEDDASMYSSDNEKALAEWNTSETHTILKMKNKATEGITGCDLQMWLEITKNI